MSLAAVFEQRFRGESRPNDFWPSREMLRVEPDRRLRDRGSLAVAGALVPDLTDAQREKLKPLLTPKRRPDGRGRPGPEARAVLNGILWVLRTGAPWQDLPDRHPPYQTCHRRFQQLQRDGTLIRRAWNS